MTLGKSAVLLVLTALILSVLGCHKDRIVLIHSLDRSQCISLIDQEGYRYIINGEHEAVPESGYVKLVAGKFLLGDCVYICWRNADYEWEAVVDYSRIIESRLDSSKYRFSTTLPQDSMGIPRATHFRRPGCAVFSYYGMQLSPNEGAIVEIR